MNREQFRELKDGDAVRATFVHNYMSYDAFWIVINDNTVCGKHSRQFLMVAGTDDAFQPGDTYVAHVKSYFVSTLKPVTNDQ